MKRLIITLITFTGLYATSAQVSPNKKFPPQQLKDDAAFLKTQLFDAHANPFTELSKQQYEQVFANIESRLTDSLNATEFYKRIKPVFSYLSDEHSGITIDTAILDNTYANQPVFLPFNLIKKGNDCFLKDMLNTAGGLTSGNKIVRINDVPIAMESNWMSDLSLSVDEESGRTFEFLTNNFILPREYIADLYKDHWLIEVLFKRVKQKFQFKYFLGDDENAIKV